MAVRLLNDRGIMTLSPSVLCPIDFSEGSRGALRYAGAIAAHFHARLILLAVNDPLLTEAADLAGGSASLKDDTIREMEKFFQQAFGPEGEGFRGRAVRSGQREARTRNPARLPRA